MEIAFYIGSGQKGTVLSAAKELSVTSDCTVYVIARDNNVADLAKKLLPRTMHDSIISLSKIKEKLIVSGSIVERALRMESIIDEYSSMLSSYDRGIGQGYLGNADRHPHVIRSLYSQREKLENLVQEFECYEEVLKRCDARIFFGYQRPFLLSFLLRAKKIDYITYIHSRISDKFILVKDEMLQSECLIDSIQVELGNFKSSTVNNINYTMSETFLIGMSKVNYSIYQAIKQSMYICIHEVYKIIKGIKKVDSYKFCGWIPVLFRKIRARKYWIKYGVHVNDFLDMKTVIFPLHTEPEVSLMQVSPEFNNSYEIICWVSKNLPADTLLVIKEHPDSFGRRSTEYYDRLRKIGNVELSHPNNSTKDWIDRSIFTVAITGTSGYEAVYYDKPVLSYGRYQIINFLPTVFYVTSFLETRDAMKNILESGFSKNIFLKSKYALNSSLMSCSFSLPNHSKYVDSDFLVEDLGRMLSKKLHEKIPV